MSTTDGWLELNLASCVITARELCARTCQANRICRAPDLHGKNRTKNAQLLRWKPQVFKTYGVAHSTQHTELYQVETRHGACRHRDP